MHRQVRPSASGLATGMVLASGLFLAASARAQSSAGATSSVPVPVGAVQSIVPKVETDLGCPMPDPALEQDMAPLANAFLEPGRKLDFARLMKSMPPDTPSKIAAMQKRAAEAQAKDFANLCKYREENAAVLASGIRPEVVFLGDLITENWKQGDPTLFDARVLDRGISGQTTPQILLRFYPDVVALRPRVVHILAGTNDISGNTGPTTDATILANINAMIDIAKAHHIAVILSAITPTTGFALRPGFNPWPRIVVLNRKLARIASERHVTFVNYDPVLDTGDGSVNPALSNDGLHPNRDGYKVMRRLAEGAIAAAWP